MKRLLEKMLCLATVIFLVVGCGKSSGSIASSTAPRDSSVSTSGENWWENVDFSEKVTLTYPNTGSRGGGSTAALEKARELINQRSRGAITIDVIYGGALGNEVSTWTQFLEGSIELGGGGLGVLSMYTSYLDVIQLPFLINNYELEAKVFFELPEWRALVEKAVEDVGNITLLTITDYGIRHFATTDKPIKTMADIKGLKIRSIGNPVVDEALRIVGANPVTIPYTELYSALQNKIVDGEEINITSVSVQKHYEVIKYVSEIGLYPFITAGFIRNDLIESLPDGYFELIRQTFAETDREYMATTVYELQRQARQDCIDNGVQFNEIEDKAEWIKAMAPIYEKKAAEDPLYAAFISAVQALQ
jgi:TRAP-type C4-dicarboxylate transport system substrate-binding protein